MAYIVMACKVMADIVMACKVMADIVMADIVMADIVMAFSGRNLDRRHRRGRRNRRAAVPFFFIHPFFGGTPEDLESKGPSAWVYF